jgi:predicted GNAT family acetyltransferase
MAPDVAQNQELDRYELVIDGELAGFSEYRLQGTDIVFTHTEITSDDREHGLGGRLVRAALDQVRERTDYRVVAQCPFVSRWISEHPDYQDLLTR